MRRRAAAAAVRGFTIPIRACLEKLMSQGGSKDAMELFTDFAGREPRIEPLLERRGLDSADG